LKRIFGILLVVAFAVTVAGVAFGRTLEEEKTAVRDYLSVLDGKIVKARQAGQTAKVKSLQADKAGTLRRWEKLQAEMTVTPVVVPPPAAPAPRPAAKPPVVATPGLFGLGWNTDVSLGYLAGKSLVTGRGDLILDDPLGLGSIVGLSSKAVNYRLGLAGFSGNDQHDRAMKGIAVCFDGVLNLPADMLGGVESYVGGGLNYTVYRSGSYGGQIFAGLKGDIGLGSKSFVELAYGAVRSNGSTPLHSAKGVGITVGQTIVL